MIIKNPDGSFSDYSSILNGFLTLEDVYRSQIFGTRVLYKTYRTIGPQPIMLICLPIENMKRDTEGAYEWREDAETLSKIHRMLEISPTQHLEDEVQHLIEKATSFKNKELRELYLGALFDLRSRIRRNPHSEAHKHELGVLRSCVKETSPKNTPPKQHNFRSQFTNEEWNEWYQSIISRPIVSFKRKCAKCDTLSSSYIRCSCQEVVCCSEECYYDIIRDCYVCGKKVCVMCKAFHKCFQSLESTNEAFEKCL